MNFLPSINTIQVPFVLCLKVFIKRIDFDYIPIEKFNREVQSIFNQWFGCCRKVFNVTLDESIKQYEAGNRNFVNRSSLFSMITKLKADGEHDYLNQAASKV